MSSLLETKREQKKKDKAKYDYNHHNIIPEKQYKAEHEHVAI